MKTTYHLLTLLSLVAGLTAPISAQDHKPEPKTPDRWTSRASWQLPIRVMEEIGVKEGMTVAKCLKPDGKLVIIQWAAGKIDREKVDWDTPYKNSLRFYLRQIYDGDFKVVQFLTFLPLQNIYVCKPREN